MYTHQAGRKPVLQQNWQSSEKSQNFKEKNTIFNEHPVGPFKYSAWATKYISRDLQMNHAACRCDRRSKREHMREGFRSVLEIMMHKKMIINKMKNNVIFG